MASQSYAQKMNNSKVMISGLKQNVERLAKRGLGSDFTTNYENIHNEAQSLDNEQEKLKAELKTKSEILNQKIKELDALYSESKKIVKIEMDSSSWKEFGIQDKR
jgi:archaellum component FlaC